MSTPQNAPTKPAWARRAARIASALGVAAAMGIAGLTSCTDAATAPVSAPPSVSPPPSASLFKLTSKLLTTTSTLTSTITSTTTSLTGTLVHGLLWTSPVSETSVSSVIGPDGGTLSIPNGVRVIVPRGAVSSNVTFRVTRLPGIIVAYDFQPHGTTFAVPVQIEQPTGGTGLLGLLNVQPSTTVSGAYFIQNSLLDQLLGTAVVSEFRPASISADRQWIRFNVDHFSGYMVSMD